MPFPPKPSKKKDDEDFERFAEMIRPIFLRMRLTAMLKIPPYGKYMKDIVTNKRKIREAEISTMLANYTFMGGIPKKLGDPGVPTISYSIKRNYIKTALCDLGAGVSVMPLSLYRRLDLNKLTPVTSQIFNLECYALDHHCISYFIAFWLILEIPSNSRTYRESWGFRYFHI